VTNPVASICAVLAAHNRRDKTLAALRAFFGQGGGFALSAVLMDDGSTDGTPEAVAEAFPDIALLRGDGSLFWNRGMARAFREARKRGADYYLWLNDDTLLDPGALERMWRDACQGDASSGGIVVGSTRDPESGQLTYGGRRIVSRWHPGKFDLVAPRDDAVVPCDTMNGNVVLIPAAAADVVGDLDERFSHGMGDLDYGLRAVRGGVGLVVGRGFHGFCAKNPPGSDWHQAREMRQRLKRANSPKGLPMGEWAYFLRRHGNFLWPVAWLSTYRRILTG
jgi:GT2 family glycosyltransferase